MPPIRETEPARPRDRRWLRGPTILLGVVGSWSIRCWRPPASSAGHHPVHRSSSQLWSALWRSRTRCGRAACACDCQATGIPRHPRLEPSWAGPVGLHWAARARHGATPRRQLVARHSSRGRAGGCGASWWAWSPQITRLTRVSPGQLPSFVDDPLAGTAWHFGSSSSRREKSSIAGLAAGLLVWGLPRGFRASRAR